MTASPKRGSKVFELLEGGAAARKPGRKKLNVFARWARAKFYSRSHAMIVRVLGESGAVMETHAGKPAVIGARRPVPFVVTGRGELCFE
jgi:hypothetical protein